MKEIYQKIKGPDGYIQKFMKKVGDRYISACAAQAAFFLLLSIIPLITLLLAISTYLPYTSQDVLNFIMNVIPNEFNSYISGFINDLYSRAGKTVISVSVIAMLWSASKGIVALTDGFNSMYGIEQQNNFLKARLMAIVYTIIFLLFFTLIMSGYVIVSHYYTIYIRDVFSEESMWRNIFLMIRYAMSWLLLYIFILLMFVILPDGFGIPKVKEEKINLSRRIKSQMSGAAFAAISWLIISKLLILYMQYFPNISIMYGSIAGIVIVMLWLYFCMYSLFVGAIINYILSNGYLTRMKKMLK